MKKLCLYAFIFALLISCTKEKIVQSDTFEENGNIWQAWKISNPISKFDAVRDRILFEDSADNNAAVKLAGINLSNTGPRTVYAVQVFLIGNFTNIKADLDRRGWVAAPFSYLLALGREYGIYNNYNYWNLYCIDVPVKVNFGAGDEFAAVALSGNTYNQSNNRQYDMALRFIPFSYAFNGITILAYRK